MVKIILRILVICCVAVCLGSCSSSIKENTDSTKTDEQVSSVWKFTNYDDGFGNTIDAQYLTAETCGLYSDPNVENMEMLVSIFVDPNIEKACLKFSNGQNTLKGMGNMSLQIKDSEGNISSATLINMDDGTTYTIENPDIVLDLLKTEMPLSFRIDQSSWNGYIHMTFQFQNDHNFNNLLKQIPHRDKSFYNQ